MPPAWMRMGLLSWSRMGTSTARAERMGPISAGLWHWNTADEPRDPSLDRFLEDDVGLVEARLRPGLRVVVHLHRQGGPRRNRGARCGDAR